MAEIIHSLKFLKNSTTKCGLSITTESLGKSKYKWSLYPDQVTCEDCLKVLEEKKSKEK